MLATAFYYLITIEVAQLNCVVRYIGTTEKTFIRLF